MQPQRIYAQVRSLHQNSATASLVKNLQSSIQHVRDQKQEHKEEKQAVKVVPKVKNKQNQIDALNDKYRGEFRQPLLIPIIAGITYFFTKTLVKLEWSTVKFLDIPGEKERLQTEKELESKDEDELEDRDETSLAKRPMRGLGLPEVMFIGKCNVGKSSLLNALLTSKEAKKNLEFAWASRKAGYTQTLNCFNVGNRFKLIDTPGYGAKGKPEQGKQVTEYLHRRQELRRVYLLVGAEEGFSQDDITIIDLLADSGVPFEVVFTKLDKLKKTSKVERHIDESDIQNLPSNPALIFTNAEVNKLQKERRGINELRWSIFEACGLPYHTSPLKVK